MEGFQDDGGVGLGSIVACPDASLGRAIAIHSSVLHGGPAFASQATR